MSGIYIYIHILHIPYISIFIYLYNNKSRCSLLFLNFLSIYFFFVKFRTREIKIYLPIIIIHFLKLIWYYSNYCCAEADKIIIIYRTLHRYIYFDADKVCYDVHSDRETSQRSVNDASSRIRDPRIYLRR